MDQVPAMVHTSETFRRTATIVRALADLAERASLRSHPVLCLVLWILQPVATIVRDYIIRMSRHPGARQSTLAPEYLTPGIVRCDGEHRADALRLALDLRMLAAMLDALAALPFARRPILDHSGMNRFLFTFKAGFALEPQWRKGHHLPAGYTSGYHDTS